MCLTTVSKIKPKPEGYGYKVILDLWDGVFCTDFCAYPLTPGEWNKDRNRGKTINHDYRPGISYPAGFHIWKSKKAAELWVSSRECRVQHVKYRKAHTQGTQSGRKVVVATEIYFTVQGDLK